MLSSVLKSERAVNINIEIMRAFVRLQNTKEKSGLKEKSENRSNLLNYFKNFVYLQSVVIIYVCGLSEVKTR